MLYFQKKQNRINLRIQVSWVWGSFVGSVNFPVSWSNSDSNHTCPILIYQFKERKWEIKMWRLNNTRKNTVVK